VSPDIAGLLALLPDWPMKEIHPLGLVPYHIIMNALAYQADPSSVDQKKRPAVGKQEFGIDFKGQSGKSASSTAMSGDTTSLSVQNYADPIYGSNLTLSSSTSSAVGFAPDSALLGGANTHLNVSQQSSRSSSMSRYSN
jgi:hypothetical protein